MSRLTALALALPVALLLPDRASAQQPAAAAPATASPAPAVAAPSREALAARIDAIAARAQRYPIAGLTVLVARGDEAPLVRGYGVADVASGRAATPETVYRIGSISKQVTAAAILRLAESDALSLDDEIGTHLPALAGRAAGVTLRHLLSHTSGLSSAPVVHPLRTPVEQWPAGIAELQARTADSLAARPVEFAPGERWRYNNNGFVLLGAVVERVGGVPWAAYVRREMLAPLGLTMDLCRALPDAAAARLATGYDHAARGAAVATPTVASDERAEGAAGSLCATAGDLLVWQRALASGRVISPDGYRAMTTPVTLASGRVVRYGLGMELGALGPGDAHPAALHGGATPGFLSEAAHYAADGLHVVVLTNGVYAGALVSRLTTDVARAALGLPVALPADGDVAAADRARVLGTYDLGPVQVEIYEQGSHLRASLGEGQVVARLLPDADGSFVAEHDPAVRFAFVPAGDAVQLVLSQGGRAMPPARRVR